MVLSILKTGFLIFSLIAVILWVYSLATWDGVCRNDCKHCPYYEDCDREEKDKEVKNNADRK